tara:strand:- start:57 stop:440 length:384 start_codon:yes stop_codon:yes gene_type:complete
MALWTLFLLTLAVFLSFVIGSSTDSKKNDSDSVLVETEKVDSLERIFPSTPVIAQPNLESETEKESISDKKPKKTKSKKSTSKKSKPKPDLISIECPSCDAQMDVPQLNKLQEVTCKECGLSGEIEI